jgi:hypothetical protein
VFDEILYNQFKIQFHEFVVVRMSRYGSWPEKPQADRRGKVKEKDGQASKCTVPCVYVRRPKHLAPMHAYGTNVCEYLSPL